ncbi:MAG: hypothetical protein WDZ69_03545 [Candidatus Pacearchaeota archaeon]
MEYNIGKREIVLNRKLSNLDKFVLDFCKLLDEYVIVSGYVSILFGRSRATEDVDLLVPKMDKDRFLRLWEKIHNSGFECLNTSKPEEAFGMLNEHAIRFSKKGLPVPNMEFKVMKNKDDEYSFHRKIKVKTIGGELYISPLEMQIAFKLDLGSEKDLEDASHLYELFKDKLNKEEMAKIINQFGVKDKFELIKKEYGTKFRKTE